MKLHFAIFRIVLLALFAISSLTIAKAEEKDWLTAPVCNDSFTTMDKFISDIKEYMGIYFDHFGNEEAGTEEGEIVFISEDFDNQAGLQIGDRIIHINGGTSRSLSNSMLKAVCSSRQNFLSMVERNGEYFEFIGSPYSSKPIEQGSLDGTPLPNPFKLESGPVMLVESKDLAKLFDGNFAGLSSEKRKILLAQVHIGIYHAYKLERGEETLGLQSLYDDSSAPCWPYGYVSLSIEDWARYFEIPSEMMEKIEYNTISRNIIFDPKFSEIMSKYWQIAATEHMSTREVSALIEGYSCMSAEYRHFYNQLYSLVGL